jgi:predicted metalloenzyme YecM
MKFDFYKTDENRWYVNLPDYPGSIDELEMVAGADVMLDILSKHGNHISLNVTENGNGEIYLKYKPESGEGIYEAHIYGNEFMIWLCEVMLYVYGYYPQNLFINICEI